MKIYVDENMEHSIVEGLKRRKIDVISAKELGYTGKSDQFHLQKAFEVKAVILTHDVDFLRIASREGVRHSGIIFSHQKNISISQCIRQVELITNILTDDEMENHIEFL